MHKVRVTHGQGDAHRYVIRKYKPGEWRSTSHHGQFGQSNVRMGKTDVQSWEK